MASRIARHFDASIMSCAAQHVDPQHLDDAAGAFARHLKDNGAHELPIDHPDELHKLGPRHVANADSFFKRYARENPEHAKQTDTKPAAPPRRPY